MKPHALLAAALLAVLSSCSTPTEPGGSDLRARAEAPDLVLFNPGTRPVYHFVVEESTAALILWGPCTDPAGCPRVAPGETKRIPFERVHGLDGDAEAALVYWWHLEPDGEAGFRVDSLRVRRVRL